MTWSALEPEVEMDEERSVSDQSARQAMRMDGLKIQICARSAASTRLMTHQEPRLTALFVLEHEAMGAVRARELEEMGGNVQ